jgi:hypothetical protein
MCDQNGKENINLFYSFVFEESSSIALFGLQLNGVASSIRFFSRLAWQRALAWLEFCSQQIDRSSQPFACFSNVRVNQRRSLV